MRHSHLVAVAVATAIAACALPARAAESYDNCKGYIDVLPATISTQGVWCLRADKATSISSGSAITITTNNVTLDCNSFKLGGLGGGPATTATGIQVAGDNTTIRNCNIRGFGTGLYLIGSGELVEDNLFDGTLVYGMYIDGQANVIRRNRVLETGNPGTYAMAIFAKGSAEIRDNVVSGVAATDSFGDSYGIAASLVSGSIANNQVRDVISGPIGQGAGISADYGIGVSRVAIVGNEVTVGGDSDNGTVGIACDPDSDQAVRENVVSGFDTLTLYCSPLDDGNVLR